MTSADGDAAPAPAPALSAAERQRLHIMLGAVAVLAIGSFVGQALSPTLLNDAPLLLILLNPRNTFLLLVSHNVELWAFLLTGFVRLVVGDPILYLLGLWYGDAARRFLREQHSGLDGVIAWLDRWFPRIGPALVFVAPNTWVCLLAGTSGMRIRTFVALNVSGTVARLLAVWWLGDLFRPEVENVLDFFARYQWPATAVMIGLAVVQAVFSRRRGTGDVRQLQRLEDEITGDE